MSRPGVANVRLRWSLAFGAVVLLGIACDFTMPPRIGVGPSEIVVLAGGSGVTVTASVSGECDETLVWSLSEGAVGSISPEMGESTVYTPPATIALPRFMFLSAGACGGFGSAEITVLTGEEPTEDQKLLASDGAEFDRFGASVSTSGDIVVAGAPSTDDACPTEPFCNSGSAYVFTLDSGSWVEQAILTASNEAAGDRFGTSVSISGDTVVVGAPLAEDECPTDVLYCDNSGSAYIFFWDGSSWVEQAILLPETGLFGKLFGTSVAIDGEIVVVGAPGDRQAYIFTRSGATWTEQAILTASNDECCIDERFGDSVAISGETVVVGAPGRHLKFDHGAAFVFTRTGDGWSEQAVLLASDRAPWEFGISFDPFGLGTSVSIDGDTIVAGAPGGSCCQHGSAYVFTREGDDWTEQAKLLASDGRSSDRLGTSVAIDGTSIIVGAPGRPPGYIFAWTGSSWNQEDKLVVSDGELNEDLGEVVAISDGIAVIGAAGDRFKDDNSRGSAYIFNIP